MLPKARKAKGILNKPMPGQTHPEYSHDRNYIQYSPGDLVILTTDSPMYIGGTLHMSHDFGAGTLGFVLRVDEWSYMVEVMIWPTKIWLWGDDINMVNKITAGYEPQQKQT
jgi:ribosomal protein L21E